MAAAAMSDISKDKKDFNLDSFTDAEPTCGVAAAGAAMLDYSLVLKGDRQYEFPAGLKALNYFPS